MKEESVLNITYIVRNMPKSKVVDGRRIGRAGPYPPGVVRLYFLGFMGSKESVRRWCDEHDLLFLEATTRDGLARSS